MSGTVSAAEWTVGPDVSYNYQAIQSAVDGSSDNDTITVYPNSTNPYTENVVVNKTGLLIRANGTVTVQPKNPLLSVFSIDSNGNNTTIQGFNIRSGGYDNSYYGIGTVSNNGCNIIDNNILNANQAIYADKCTNVKISANSVSNSYSAAIHVLYSPTNSNNRVINNVLTGNRVGIDGYCNNNTEISGNIIQNSKLTGIYIHNSFNNIISNNTVNGTQLAPGDYASNGDGIFLQTVSNSNTISGNTISNNAHNGIHSQYSSDSNNINGNLITGNQYGIYLETGSSNTISGNIITNNAYGVLLWPGSVGNTISRNIINSTVNGIHLESSFNNIISGNNITSTGNGNGIYGYGSSDNDILSNNITTSSSNGWIFGNGIAFWSCGNSEILYNNIHAGIGIWLFGDPYDNNVAHFNRIIGTNNLVTNYSGLFNATLNWWGSNNNPGSKITGNVDYTPWIYLTINATPNTINNHETSLITASFNNQFDGTTLTALDPSLGHIPDGTPVTFNTDLGSIGCKTIDKQTSEGIATATLTADETTGTAHVNAVTDAQTVNVDININPKSSVYLTITPNKINPTAGDTVIYTLKVGNKGPDTAKDVVMTYIVPVGLEFAGATVDNGTYTYDAATRTITWTIGNVPVGDPNMWLSLHINQAGQYIINPTLRTSTYDPTLNQNTQSLTVQAATQTTTTVKAATNTKTIAMQQTGTPLNYIILAILMVFGGLVSSKRR